MKRYGTSLSLHAARPICGGLAEEEPSRRTAQRRADPQALSHAQGVSPDPPVGGLPREPDLVEHPVDLIRADTGEVCRDLQGGSAGPSRSEEHTSELQ